MLSASFHSAGMIAMSEQKMVLQGPNLQIHVGRQTTIILGNDIIADTCSLKLAGQESSLSLTTVLAFSLNGATKKTVSSFT